ncbi:alpha-hydroxy-acid oxidizing protein [Natronosporangium hydrolyticum]|uniref:Alpha-hydroxy-acid oxidizing protein n=1 Tax=Natronosporangium hydrolyticum TaxID=2811111 RepID=A0A895YC94_9ACTN|nr:alpha-hydroxy acid oxidase [Natronosporangium hydrolyticum]QSB13063.1 alpha-hydroxy-acid oxidizing protein [Natronosporangium hydrolyticum]
MAASTNPDLLAAQARAALDRDAYDYLATGAGQEVTLTENLAGWRLPLRPRVLRDVSTVDTETSLLGTPVAAPLGVAPLGFQRWFHPDGEVATAKGAAASLFVLSMRATTGFDQLTPVAGPWWCQVYRLQDRQLTVETIRQAVAAGARALVLTVDTPYAGEKARPTEPPAGLPVNALLPGQPGWDDPRCWVAADLSLADIGWFREISGLPVVVKGVLRGDDARECLAAGAAAIWVSNHGGRQLDGAVATATALPEVVAAVADRAEVYVDGGVRSGRDVARALALGARAAFLGRPVAWALAAGGVAGVRSLLDGIHAELWEAMALLGCATVDELIPDLVTGLAQ